MGDIRNAHKIWFERSTCRWRDDIKIDFGDVSWNWTGPDDEPSGSRMGNEFICRISKLLNEDYSSGHAMSG